MRARTAAAITLAIALLELGPLAATATADPGGAPPQAPAPAQTTAPSKPKYTPPAEDPDDESPTPGASATPTPTPSYSYTPRPDPEGDRWLQLAIYGGGGLLGAVILFMIIGSLLRLKYRRQARRNQQ
ncbi:MAG: hypothetical protein VB080_11920 [Propionicimonas sp.]|uniref:hypothetical protein n=1 Tax=Propionicimonas sp. TaxID=1955623 RepID=UPI002B209EEA|nr:hypothetical protein [Propionicimonas sp.]MEA4945130.1 hypothetical protein [Propionicimonas sp.]MEA5053153.1 hypothetical protein [Propionicimonas sp.]MEA5117593.1 hypothetical protein [Propionicimonas sp.]